MKVCGMNGGGRKWSTSRKAGKMEAGTGVWHECSSVCVENEKTFRVLADAAWFYL